MCKIHPQMKFSILYQWLILCIGFGNFFLQLIYVKCVVHLNDAYNTFFECLDFVIGSVLGNFCIDYLKNKYSIIFSYSKWEDKGCSYKKKIKVYLIYNIKNINSKIHEKSKKMCCGYKVWALLRIKNMEGECLTC